MKRAGLYGGALNGVFGPEVWNAIRMVQTLPTAPNPGGVVPTQQFDRCRSRSTPHHLHLVEFSPRIEGPVRSPGGRWVRTSTAAQSLAGHRGQIGERH